jgi:hypothetical protein
LYIRFGYASGLFLFSETKGLSACGGEVTKRNLSERTGGIFMRLKLDDKGSAVLQDGKPVYVHDDGKEVSFDAAGAVAKIAELTRECAQHRTHAKELGEKLKDFGDIDPRDAKKALATLEKIDQKTLIDAGKVDEVKKQFVQQIDEMKQAYEGKLSKATETNVSLENELSDYMIKQAFSGSKIMEKLHESITPDIAHSFFGKDFKREKINGQSVIVGQVNGQPIISRLKPGENAAFDEALEVLIERYPLKDRILKGADGGSGSAGNGKSGLGTIPGEKVFGMSLADYNQAVKDGKIKVT